MSVTNPPRIVGTGPCPTHGGDHTFRAYWDKTRQRYTPIATAHCGPCWKETGRTTTLKMLPDGTITFKPWRHKATTKPCPDCGDPITARAVRCRSCHLRRRAVLHPCAFRNCDEQVPGDRTYCTHLCRKAEASARRRERANTGQRGTPLEGWTRDDRLTLAYQHGYLCSWCGTLIDVSLHPNHADSLTVDHTTPVIAGGTDQPDNLTPMHRRCNSQKGATLTTTMPPLPDKGPPPRTRPLPPE